MSAIEEFNAYRERMNRKMMDAPNNKIMKRIFSLDTLTYQDGALDSKTKEMLGLVASMVLRCDDCIKYHLLQCHELGVTQEEIMEIFGEDGTRMECSLEEIRPLVPEGCAYCIDMTSEFSDISVGVMEGRPEMNTLIVRTDRGERIVDEAVSAGFLEISDMPPDNLEHLTWAAGNKKKRALLRARERGIINSGGGKEPSYLLMNAEVLTRLTEEERGR